MDGEQPRPTSSDTGRYTPGRPRPQCAPAVVAYFSCPLGSQGLRGGSGQAGKEASGLGETGDPEGWCPTQASPPWSSEASGVLGPCPCDLSLPGPRPLAEAGLPSPPTTTLLATGVVEVAHLTSGLGHLHRDVLLRQE